eukprot:gnl/TRDRNA2_/TRDRNA2_169482_c1_seq2.p1 gnl/TRDRNA2_/TRDRNA2_169482_c1~~gnl/TRDRNA2_/TRDRNA2_169482_c1_seq2.p1  ORF type:complete len:605 (+),score=63.11 gnl/TRDRNA2_/TRDRNA2_169482_c1_seq2:112-1815(+)
MAFVLRYLSSHSYIDLDMFDILNTSSIYSGFTYVLGFSLVFRTSQSYSRFWTAATSVHDMGSEWTDACGSLVSFAQSSTMPEERTEDFIHTLVRLFSLLHAMALEEIACVRDQTFPLLDIEGFNHEDLEVLTNPEVQGNKVHVVLCWIKMHIVRAMDDGLLSTPPPIITRAFQELGAGLVKFHNANQVVIWPFPFPYAQMNFVLLWLYMVLTPIMCSTWNVNPFMSGAFSCVSVICMLGLDLIASELENPFGHDVNDLPVVDMQHGFNKNMCIYIHPGIWSVPELLPTARRDLVSLKSSMSERRPSLSEYVESSKSLSGSLSRSVTGSFVKQVSGSLARQASKVFDSGIPGSPSHEHRLQKATSWGSNPPEETDYMRKLLGMPSSRPDSSQILKRVQTRSLHKTQTGERAEEALLPKNAGTEECMLPHLLKPSAASDIDPPPAAAEMHLPPPLLVDGADDEAAKTPFCLQWDQFLRDLSRQLQQHLDQEVRLLGSLNERNLKLTEQLLSGVSSDPLMKALPLEKVRAGLDSQGTQETLGISIETPHGRPECGTPVCWSHAGASLARK